MKDTFIYYETPFAFPRAKLFNNAFAVKFRDCYIFIRKLPSADLYLNCALWQAAVINNVNSFKKFTEIRRVTVYFYRITQGRCEEIVDLSLSGLTVIRDKPKNFDGTSLRTKMYGNR